MVDLMCCFLVSLFFCFVLHLFFPTNLCLARLGHWLGLLYVPLSFCPALASSSISSSSCRGAQLLRMSVGGFTPHLGELDLGICFNLSIFDILNWKATEISSFTLRLEVCVISQHFFLKHSGTLFSLGVSACSWRKSVLSLASSSLH